MRGPALAPPPEPLVPVFRKQAYELNHTVREVSLVWVLPSHAVSGSAVPCSTAHANARDFPLRPTRLAKAQAGPRDPSTDHCEVCHCVLMGVGLVKPGTSLFLTLKAAWVCVPHIALCGRWP